MWTARVNTVCFIKVNRRWGDRAGAGNVDLGQGCPYGRHWEKEMKNRRKEKKAENRISENA